MNKYSLSPIILNNIANIERLYGQLEALRIPEELQLNLERNNIVQSSYISNSLLTSFRRWKREYRPTADSIASH